MNYPYTNFELLQQFLDVIDKYLLIILRAHIGNQGLRYGQRKYGCFGVWERTPQDLRSGQRYGRDGYLNSSFFFSPSDKTSNALLDMAHTLTPESLYWIFINRKKKNSQITEMARQVRSLSYNHDGLSSNPQNAYKPRWNSTYVWVSPMFLGWHRSWRQEEVCKHLTCFETY